MTGQPSIILSLSVIRTGLGGGALFPSHTVDLTQLEYLPAGSSLLNVV